MEWRSYGLSDFLMFSPQVYARLLERYNQALWPAQGVLLLLGAAVLAMALRRPGGRPLAACIVLAGAWSLAGWGFHWQRYAGIFIAAPALAIASWVEAALLLAGAALPARPQADRSITHGIGAALLAAGVLLYPLLAVATGAGWARAEVFGLMPDPTALATLGWLLASHALPDWMRAGLALIPAASLLLGLLTRSALSQ